MVELDLHEFKMLKNGIEIGIHAHLSIDGDYYDVSIGYVGEQPIKRDTTKCYDEAIAFYNKLKSIYDDMI